MSGDLRARHVFPRWTTVGRGEDRGLAFHREPRSHAKYALESLRGRRYELYMQLRRTVPQRPTTSAPMSRVPTSPLRPPSPNRDSVDYLPVEPSIQPGTLSRP